MRVHITFELTKPTNIPVNYQEYLTAAIYGYIAGGDTEYAKFVHDEGYASEKGTVYKPFTHSWLRMPASRRRIVGDRLQILPGTMGWAVSSPLDDFLRPFANGLLKKGNLRIGTETLDICAVTADATPDLSGTAGFICLSPIVASTRRPDGTTQYLRPTDDPAAFSEAIQKNLVNKYQAFHGHAPADTAFKLEFDTNYLAANRGGTKKSSFRGVDVIGIYAPFKVEGSVDLLRLGHDAGFGSKTACGFGCAEVKR